MNLAVDANLIGAARELGPIIREHADEAERERRPSKAVMDALAEAGLQRMFTPRSLGGLEADPVTYARVAEEIAGYDSVAGWALQVGNHVAWWCSRLPEEGVAEIYTEGPDTLIAGAFHPPRPAIEANGGYRITGQAPLASNIHDADWLLLTGIVMDGGQPKTNGGEPELIQVILPANDVEIVDTWRALGMRGTDSNDVAVEDVYVPAWRTFRLGPDPELGPHYQGPLYKFPGIGAVETIFTPVMLAIGRQAITEFRELATKKTPLGAASALRDRGMAQATLGEAEAMLRSARAFFYETLAEAWRRTEAGEPSTLEHRADLMLAGTHAANTVAKVTDMMHNLAGASAIYESNRLERHFRDAQTLRNHGFVSRSRYETVGQVYLGVQPEFPFVQL